MKTATMLIVALLAGCASAPVDEPEEMHDDPPAEPEFLMLVEESAKWPTTPGAPASFPFEVPEGTTKLEARFNWQGQQPGGFSSSRAGVIVAPDGEERIFTDADLPANPYLCASSTCGPPQDRIERFDDPVPGTWRFELRGAYTATAFFSANATVMPAAVADGHDHS